MGKPIDLIPSSSCRYPDDIPVTSLLHPHYIPINWLALHTRVRWILCIKGLQWDKDKDVARSLSLWAHSRLWTARQQSPLVNHNKTSASCGRRDPWDQHNAAVIRPWAARAQGEGWARGLWMAVDGCGCGSRLKTKPADFEQFFF